MKITNLEVPGYERVARAEDEASGLRAFISVHSTRLGPSLGGMRLWPYATDDAALEDVLRLSRAMTYKSAVAGTGLGGGKSVVIADPSQKTDELFEAMGRFVDDFGGTYITAEDVNVGIPDLRSVQRTTSHVTGLTVEEGGGGNPRAATALGCFLGVGAGVARGLGQLRRRRQDRRRQGLGSVGFGLAEHLAEAGARVLATDVNPERVEHAASELGVEVVDPDGSTASSATSSRRAPSAASSTTTRSLRLRCAVIAGGGEQPAPRRGSARRAAAGTRDRLRARLRDQRRRRHQHQLRVAARGLRRRGSGAGSACHPATLAKSSRVRASEGSRHTLRLRSSRRRRSRRTSAAGQATLGRESAKRRHRIVPGPRDDENGAVLRAC